MELAARAAVLAVIVRALLASAIVGVVCAVVGTYVVLRGIAFIGDAIAHAAFPGVVVAYMLGVPVLPRRRGRRGRHGARDRLRDQAVAGSARTRRSASCSPAPSPSACSCSARSTATSPTCSASCWATCWPSAPGTSSRCWSWAPA